MLRTILTVAVVFSAITVSAQSYTDQSYTEISSERIRHFNQDNFPSLTYETDASTAPAFETTVIPETIEKTSEDCTDIADILGKISKSASGYLEKRAIRNATAKQPRYNLQALQTVCRDPNLMKEFAYGDFSTQEIVEQEIATREALEEIQEFAGNE